MLQKLSSFSSSERSRFDTRHNNIFAFVFSQVERRYKSLLLIAERYRQSSKLFIDNHKKLQALLDKSSGSHLMTKRQMQILKKGGEITIKLHLEIESFYLFSKIMLDEIARALEFYFGQERSLSLDSHHLLCKNLAKFSANKGLLLNKNMVRLAKKLKKDISDFRDYQIAHHKCPRTMRGTIFGSTGEARISLNRIYPRPDDIQVETKTIKELEDFLSAYVNEVIDFFKKNKDKTNLQLKV